MRTKLPPLVVVAAVAMVACGDRDHGAMTMMMGPNGVTPQRYGAAFMSVMPAGGSTGVPTSISVTLRFGAAMAVAMERYVDLHLGDLGGPTLPMGCAWSADRTTLTCTPGAALQPRTAYVLHLGGGMMSESGERIDYALYGPMIGGRWIMGGMMGLNHGGQPWDMMGSGWRHTNGSYGMAFAFTTA
jgi:hypothetical protein